MKLKALHIRRLRKLIDFLRKLPRKRFNFAIVRTEPPKCGAVGCAIGYTPNVFPRSIKPIRDANRDLWTHGVCLRGQDYSDFNTVASWVSGLPEPECVWLFEPNQQSRVHLELADLPEEATPKQVARMLEKFIQLHS